MTEEEKKAIKYLKNEIERVNKENNFKKMPKEIVCIPLFLTYSETLLNLIEKQEEIKELKSNSIPKDKIRELFKELYMVKETKFAKIKTTDNDKLYKFAKDIQKLLEEE